MKKLSFPTVKLGNFIREVKEKVKNSGVSQDNFTVYGVTNTDGITVTNNKASDDLGNYTVLRENQFAYNPYRVNVGSIGLSLPGTFGAVSPAYVVFETIGQISNEFLLYYLKSSLGINLIKWYGDRGGVRSALRFSDLKKIDFPDITLEQQNKLLTKIKKLDELLCELGKNLSDDKIEILRQSILQQAVEGKLCEQDPKDEPANVLLEKIKAEKERLVAEKKIKKQKPLPPISEEEKPFDLPHGWEFCRLQEITSIISDIDHCMPKSVEKENGVLFLSAKDLLDDGTINYTDNVKYISLDDYNRLSKKVKPSIDDIIYSRIGACLGKARIVDREVTFLVSYSCCVIRPLYVSPRYLRYYLECPTIATHAANKKQSIGVPDLGMGEIKKYIIAVPPLAEQLRIVNRLDQLVGLCDDLKKTIIQSKECAAQIIEAILKENFSTQEPAQSAQVIEFHSNQTTPETKLLAAARGKLREDTWEHLCKRALEIVGEES